MLRGKSREIDSAVQAAYDELIRRIRQGDDPRAAVNEAMAGFSGKFAEIQAAGLSVVLSESIGSTSALSRPVGPITLSQRLYAQTQATSSVVESVVQDHVRGFQQSRALALDLFEGYGFRESEVLNIAKGNTELPRYMREALLDDTRVTNGFRRAFAKLQVDNLTTPELRVAYRQALDAVDALEQGAGNVHLEKKLRVAFYERMRYFAKRIAETELHRSYAQQQAIEYMHDSDIEYVQWRLSPMHPVEDICDYFAGVNLYGLGPGVYPKALAPVAPAHPFCKCVLSPRLDLNGRKPSVIEDADQRFFSRFGLREQRMIAGSQAKLDQVQSGRSAWEVHNARISPEYRVKRAGEL